MEDKNDPVLHLYHMWMISVAFFYRVPFTTRIISEPQTVLKTDVAALKVVCRVLLILKP